MITFVPKPSAVPASEPAEESRFDRIRRLAAEKHQKADAGTIGQDPQTAGDKRPM
ncbi:hypothetical protein [Mesorhizobium silamurunense]|uniref:hypothetical protein n=1 Tax=Mesorhizobium silamurunense TaxID=499528 RepID=UPI001780DFFE|nr:hypothetical protein [Mesorhizobium silamurunense]